MLKYSATLSWEDKLEVAYLHALKKVEAGLGPQGPIGPQGPQGVQGNVGATGLQGPIGFTGLTGSIGPIGAQGPQGVMGATGATGAKGDSGDVGPQGPIGLKGDTGNVGATGATGAQGPQGVKGDTGATGPIGLTGPQGLQGIQGIQGIQGLSGIGAGPNPACRVVNSATQAVATGSSTVYVNFDTEVFDTDNMFDPAVPNRLTCKTEGYYQLSSNIKFGVQNSGTRVVEIRVNNVTVAHQASPYAPNEFTVLCPSTLFHLNVGDYIQVLVYQDSGVSVNILKSTSATNTLSVTKVDAKGIKGDTGPAGAGTETVIYGGYGNLLGSTTAGVTIEGWGKVNCVRHGNIFVFHGECLITALSGATSEFMTGVSVARLKAVLGITENLVTLQARYNSLRVIQSSGVAYGPWSAQYGYGFSLETNNGGATYYAGRFYDTSGALGGWPSNQPIYAVGNTWIFELIMTL